MGILSWIWPRPDELSEQEKETAVRKCKPQYMAYGACRQANPENPTAACKNLETTLVVCFGDKLCPEESRKHTQCMTKYMADWFSRGHWPSVTCDKEVDEIKGCLRRYKMYPL